MITSSVNNGTYFNIDEALDFGFSVRFLSSAVMESVGANYSKEQVNRTIKVADNYMKRAKIDETITEEIYTRKISGILSYSAQQEYNIMN